MIYQQLWHSAYMKAFEYFAKQIKIDENETLSNI